MRRKNTKPLPIFDQLNTQLFWAYADKPTDDKCWHWLGSIGVNGYPRFSIHGRSYYAHRISYFLAKGIDPGILDVLHGCDNPACVNPNHLRMGNDLDNSKDKFERQRTNFQRGQSHHSAKLNDEQVHQIRALCASGKFSQDKIAHIYNVSQTTINGIHRRRRWKSLI